MFATANVQEDCESDSMSMVKENEEYVSVRSPYDSRLISLFDSVVEVENNPAVSLLLVRHQLNYLTCCYLKYISDKIVTY